MLFKKKTLYSSVRGEIKKNVNLSTMTRFGVGGCADTLFFPEDIDDLITMILTKPTDVPVTVLGAASNVLISDDGIEGIVIKLTKGAGTSIFSNDQIIEAGAGVMAPKISAYAIDNNIAGLEFLSGIPGTIGGCLKINAGCYGNDISNVLSEFEAIDLYGNIHWKRSDEIKFTYRNSDIPENWIITRVWLRGTKDKSELIAKRTNEIINLRKNTQPIEQKCCGSTFKNPEDHKAWELIDAAGCKNMKFGGAEVSQKHSNFVINAGNATAHHIDMLCNEIIEKVYLNSGITLEREIKKIGRWND